MKFSVAIVCVAVMAALFECAECNKFDLRNSKIGMPAPKILYSCTVENILDTPIDVEVSYTHPFENRIIVDRATLASGENKFFDRRTFQNVDGASYSAGITGVVAKDPTDPSKEIFVGKDDFKIYSPSVNYKLHVVPAENSVGFEFQHSASL